LEPNEHARQISLRKLLAEKPTARAFRGDIAQTEGTKPLDPPYGLIMYPSWNFDRHVSVQAQLNVLGAIRELLGKGGRFSFAIWKLAMRAVYSPALHRESPNFEGIRIPCLSAVYSRAYRVLDAYEFQQRVHWQICHYLLLEDGGRRRYTEEFRHQYHSHHEMIHLLHRCGFEIVDQFGSYDKTLPIGHCDSHDLVYVAEAV
jgi:hypothetical protein